ncbi:hypothetical protein K474DRAFT_1668819 [Panus rudis PR-1116 ss-1]|nr:hypothetical protein K474DRAFT_1668819 [Panus rudis PR-1116 ss-1]
MFNFVALLVLVTILTACSTSAINLPPHAAVHLRIEGSNKTIYEGPIVTFPHNVTTESGGTHHCDGTNNNENPTPGPTCTTALDDASKVAGFTWDGTFFTEFDDYFITRIASDTGDGDIAWGILVDFQFTPVGGCQQEVKDGDYVLWAFDAFTKAHFLKLSGPTTARVNQLVTFVVTDGATGEKLAGARVAGDGFSGTTDGNGEVQFKFTSHGLHSFKAEREDSIRSNRAAVLVL